VDKATILSLEQVTLKFSGLTVLKDLSFDIRQGSRTALIGPNGAGKTSVFNVVTGAYSPSSGAVRFRGHDITRMPSRKRIRAGVARNFQNIRLMPHLTAIENVMIGQHSRGQGLLNALQPVALFPGNRWRREARDALASASLQKYERQLVGALPYGVQKRIELVRALQADPSLLLLDEPAAGLNLAEKHELAELLTRLLGEDDRTLLIVEHDMDFIGSLCEHVIVLNFGQKIAEGSCASVRCNPVVQEAYLGASVDSERRGACCAS